MRWPSFAVPPICVDRRGNSQRIRRRRRLSATRNHFCVIGVSLRHSWAPKPRNSLTAIYQKLTLASPRGFELRYPPPCIDSRRITAPHKGLCISATSADIYAILVFILTSLSIEDGMVVRDRWTIWSKHQRSRPKGLWLDLQSM